MADNLINNQDDDELSTTQEYLIAGSVILFFGLLYWLLNHGWGAVATPASTISTEVATQARHPANEVKMPTVLPNAVSATVSTPTVHTPAQTQQGVTNTMTAPAAPTEASAAVTLNTPASRVTAIAKPAEPKPTDATTAIAATATPSGAATDAGPLGQPGATQPVQTAQAQPPEGAAIPAGATGVAADFETQLRQAMAKHEVNQVFVFDKLQFESGSHKITASSDAQLHAVAALLQANPHIRVLIRGHTDETGIPGNNTELSLLRANEVGVALVNLGVDRRRLRIMGMGDSTPIADNATEAGRQLNRRVDLMILP